MVADQPLDAVTLASAVGRTVPEVEAALGEQLQSVQAGQEVPRETAEVVVQPAHGRVAQAEARAVLPEVLNAKAVL